MQSFVSCLMHCVFATKDRYPWLTQEVQERLWPHIAGVARENRMNAVTVGGVADHVHILLSIPSTLSIAKAMQLLKGNSSKWIHETFSGRAAFAWQNGYGAFSVSYSHVDRVKGYLARQADHHRTRTFQEEFVAFLRRHGIEYDERYLWE